MSAPREKKQELREMSRKDALKAFAETLQFYKEHGYSGRIVIDVRSGKPIWIAPIIEDLIPAGEALNEEIVVRDVAGALRRFSRERINGNIEVLVYQGNPVAVKRAIELARVRVG